jgi:hypothetical protein
MMFAEIFPPTQVIVRPQGCFPVRTSPVRKSPQFQIVLEAMKGSAGHCLACADHELTAEITTMINPNTRITCSALSRFEVLNIRKLDPASGVCHAQ